MAERIENALIRSVWLGIEDHGLLSAFVHLDYGNAGQGFGGYNLGCTGANYCGLFVRRTLEVVGSDDWAKLVGKPCRAKIADGLVVAIGHFLDDKWFKAGDELRALEMKVST